MEENGKLSVFVSGATTFLGRYLTRRLVAAGHSVTGMTVGAEGASIVRRDGGLPVYADPTRPGEIRSVLMMAQADVFVHAAPQRYNQIPHYRSVWSERETKANELAVGTVAALEAAQAAGVKYFIHASYAFLYGDRDGHWVDESAALRAPGESNFFKAALFAEQVVAGQSAVPAAILRLGFGYCEYSEALQEIASRLKRGREIITGSASAFANWIHAEDAANAIIQVALRPQGGAVFNLVDDTPLSPAAFANQLADALGVAHPRVPLLPLTRPTAVQQALLTCSLRVRNDQAKAALNWKPKYPSARQGLEQTLVSWRAGEAATA